MLLALYWEQPFLLSDYLIAILIVMFFYVWITKILLPELPENSVIFMDNASFHKGKNIEQAIINAGHQIEYLPVYSPDLNPIEHKWSQAKRKKMETGCTIDDLFLIHML